MQPRFRLEGGGAYIRISQPSPAWAPQVSPGSLSCPNTQQAISSYITGGRVGTGQVSQGGAGCRCRCQGSSEAGVISQSQNEDFSTFQISELRGLQLTSLNLRISRKYGFRVVTLSQIQFGTDSENSIYALFWLDDPSN